MCSTHPSGSVRNHRKTCRGELRASKSRSPGPSAGVSFAGGYVSDFGRQATCSPLAGANPEAASVAVGRASALARLVMFGDRMLWNFARVAAAQRGHSHIGSVFERRSVHAFNEPEDRPDGIQNETNFGLVH